MLTSTVLHANAQQATADGDLAIERPWARATDADNRSAAIYFTLRNTGQATVDEIGVRTDRASIEVLHKTTVDSGGAARMSAAPELKVAPGEMLKLEPGGMHVMLIDVETLPLRLKFYNRDDITVDVPIFAADASGPQE